MTRFAPKAAALVVILTTAGGGAAQSGCFEPAPPPERTASDDQDQPANDLLGDRKGNKVGGASVLDAVIDNGASAPTPNDSNNATERTLSVAEVVISGSCDVTLGMTADCVITGNGIDSACAYDGQAITFFAADGEAVEVVLTASANGFDTEGNQAAGVATIIITGTVGSPPYMATCGFMPNVVFVEEQDLVLPACTPLSATAPSPPSSCFELEHAEPGIGDVVPSGGAAILVPGLPVLDGAALVYTQGPEGSTSHDSLFTRWGFISFDIAPTSSAVVKVGCIDRAGCSWSPSWRGTQWSSWGQNGRICGLSDEGQCYFVSHLENAVLAPAMIGFGEAVGDVGSSGFSTGRHLHSERVSSTAAPYEASLPVPEMNGAAIGALVASAATGTTGACDALADTKLKDAINATLGHPVGSPIDDDVAATITDLFVRGAGITSFGGIGNCLQNLAMVDARDNAVGSFQPFAGTNLRWLRVNNYVGSLASSGIASISTLRDLIALGAIFSGDGFQGAAQMPALNLIHAADSVGLTSLQGLVGSPVQTLRIARTDITEVPFGMDDIVDVDFTGTAVTTPGGLVEMGDAIAVVLNNTPITSLTWLVQSVSWSDAGGRAGINGTAAPCAEAVSVANQLAALGVDVDWPACEQ